MGYMTKAALSAVVLVALVTSMADAIAVMSIDLGSEWMKVAIVSPGVPMEIALNKESKRKTPACVSFRSGERAFGEDAQTVGVRFPRNAYTYLLDLLGKTVDHPAVQLFRTRFPHYEIVPDPHRGTVLFKHDSDTTYSVEELVAMLLHKGREFATLSAGQAVNEAVITVPGFFNQAERKALMQAAQLADIKVLQLINDYMAVALNYGIFRRKDFNESAQYVMFYDMGAASTSATVISYQLVKHKERGIVETIPQVAVLGVGYDRALGGLEMQIRLRDHLARKFNEMKKTQKNVFDDARAMAKLLKEAGRVKNVLSANVDHFAQIEGLLDEIDFRVQVTRVEFESLCADLFARVKAPVERALKVSGLTQDIISQVVLVGAGTRVPKVQEELSSVVNMELSKNLNTDEAACMGAVYRAADLSTGFKVKKFITKDAVLFPIQVTFDRESGGGEIGGGAKPVKRTLFGPMNPYPQKKILTFNKHQSDFSFTVHYADLDHLPDNEIQLLGPLNLSTVVLSGVGEALDRHRGVPNVESKGVKAHWQLDDSGLLALTTVELVLERTVGPDELDSATDQSPLSKLGNTISKLFTGPEEALKENLEKPVHVEPEETKEPEGSAAKKEEASSEGGKRSEEEGGEDKKNTTASSGSGEKKKPKVVVIKEPINASLADTVVPAMAEEPLQASMSKIEALNRHDEDIVRRESALNALESYVFDIKTKLDEEEEFKKAATTEEADAIAKIVAETMDWLEEEGFGADAVTLESRLADLKLTTRPVRRRVKEAQERPEAVAALLSTINGSRNFLHTIRNLTGDGKDTDELGRPMFTPIEMDTLDKAINDTQDWLDKMVKEQDQLAASENPTLTVKVLIEKMGTLDREVKYLVNKAKIWRPKVKKETSNATSSKPVKEEESEKEEKVIEPAAKEVDDSKQKETSSTKEEQVIETNDSTTSEKPDQRTKESSTKETKPDDKHTEL